MNHGAGILWLDEIKSGFRWKTGLRKLIGTAILGLSMVAQGAPIGPQGVIVPGVVAMPDPVPTGGLVTHTVTLANPAGQPSGFQIDGMINVGFGSGDLSPANQTVTAMVDGMAMGNWNCTAGSPGTFSCIPAITAVPVGDLTLANHEFSFTTQYFTGMAPDTAQLNLSCGVCGPSIFGDSVTVTGVAPTPADMSINAGTDLPGPFNPGDMFNYQVDITNTSMTSALDAAKFRIESTDIAIVPPADPNWFCVVITNGAECEFTAIIPRQQAGPQGVSTLPGGATTSTLNIPAMAPNQTGNFAAQVTLVPPLDNVIGTNPITLTRGVVPQNARLRVTGSAPAQVPRTSTITYNFQIENFDDPGDLTDGKDSTNIALDIFFDEIPFNFSSDAQLLGFSGSGWTCMASLPGNRQQQSQNRPAGGFSLGYFCNWTGVISVGQATSSLQIQVRAPDNAPIDFQATAFPSGTDNSPQPGDELNLITGITNVVDADLELTKTVSKDVVVAGETYAYQLQVENFGPATAFDVHISDSLPAGVVSQGFSGNDWTCFLASGNVVGCDYTGSGIDVGFSSLLTLQVIAPQTPGVITNTARVISNQDDLPDNNSASVDVTVASDGFASLSLTKQALLGSVSPGDPVEYLLTVTNQAPNEVPTVAIIDTLPGGVQFVSAIGTGWDCTESAGTVTCVNPLLAGDEISSVLLTVLAPSSEGQITNTAQVESALTELDSSDNTASAATTVAAGTDLAIVKSVDKPSIQSGESVMYDIQVSNAGTVVATGVTVTDNLPVEFSLDAVMANGWSCDTLSVQVVCVLMSDLGPGEVAGITLDGHITASPGSSVNNTASVFGDLPDINPSNNSDGVSVQVVEDASGAPADLIITKTDPGRTVLTGDSFVYNLNVLNDGPAQVTNYLVIDSVPAELTVDSVASMSAGVSCSVDGQQVLCHFLGNMSPGDEIDISIAVIAPDTEATVTNTAFLQTDFQDPDESSNTSSITTEIAFTPSQEELSDSLNEALGSSADPIVTNNLDPIANLCADPLPAVVALCREIADALADGRGDEVAEAIRETVGQMTSSQHTSMIEAGTAQLANIVARLRDIRGGRGGGKFNISGLSVRMGRQGLPIGLLQSAFEDEEPEIGSENLIKSWGFFINGTIGGGDHDSTALEDGFDFDTLGITAGVDYRPSLKGVIGAAIGWADFESDFEDGSTLQTDGYTLSVYASYYPTDRFYMDGRLSWGQMDFEQRRRVNFTIGNLVMDDVAFGATESDSWSGAVSIGYLFNRDTWNITPSANVAIFQADIDPFMESGSDLALSYEGQEVDSLIASASFSVSKVFSTSRGVFTPQFDISFHHEAKNDDNSLNSQIIGSSATSAFFIDTDDPDSNFASASLGFVFVSANGKQAYLTYREILGLDDFSRWTVNLGMRFEF